MNLCAGLEHRSGAFAKILEFARKISRNSRIKTAILVSCV